MASNYYSLMPNPSASSNVFDLVQYSLMHKKTEKSILRFLFIKSSKNNFIFLPVFYLVMSLMKAQKNFGKIAILKIWELISLGGAKTHFGKIALK